MAAVTIVCGCDTLTLGGEGVTDLLLILRDCCHSWLLLREAPAKARSSWWLGKPDQGGRGGAGGVWGHTGGREGMTDLVMIS